MKIAVVTPYYDESLDVLERCISSVALQTHKDVIHVLVADGKPRNFDVHKHHIILPGCADVGNTPKFIGTLYAFSQDVDGIVLLDADCWIEPSHISALIDAHKQSGCGIVTCPRKLWDKEGKIYLGVDLESNGLTFNDSNCYLITKPYFPLFNAWGFISKQYSYIGDRPFWAACNGHQVARTGLTMVNYPTHHAHHYEMFNLEPPKGSVKIVRTENGFERVTL